MLPIKQTAGQLPKDATGTTIETTDYDCVYTHGTTMNASSPNISLNDNDSIWATAPAWISALLMKDCMLPSSWYNIAMSIKNETCIAVTDGFFAPTEMVATAFWVIEGENGVRRCKGAAHTPGTREEMDAYRAKIFGIYCILTCLKYICEREKLKKRKSDHRMRLPWSPDPRDCV